MELQMTLTNRKGRKRKSGYRQPNGQLRRETVDYMKLASEQPHRRGLPADCKLSQDAETQLGRLYLRKQITEPMLRAGEEYARRVGAYMATICAPHGMVGSGRWTGCNPDACRKEPDQCECTRRLRDYQEFHEVTARCGRRVEMVMKRIIVNGNVPGTYELAILLVGLSALTRHMHLTARGKSRYA